MEKELYYTKNKLISKSKIYFYLNPCQFNNIINFKNHRSYCDYVNCKLLLCWAKEREGGGGESPLCTPLI